MDTTLTIVTGSSRGLGRALVEQSLAEAAQAAVDLNVILLLFAMMALVGVLKTTNVFPWAVDRLLARSRGNPSRCAALVIWFTGILSALLDNVTTVLLIVPVTLVICQVLHVKPYNFLFAEIFASNIGGTATLIGDPPNILIGSAVGLTFNDFVLALAPVIVVVFAVQTAINHLIWGKSLHASRAHRDAVMAMHAIESIQDRRLLKCSLAVIAAVIAVLFGPLLVALHDRYAEQERLDW